MLMNVSGLAAGIETKGRKIACERRNNQASGRGLGGVMNAFMVSPIDPTHVCFWFFLFRFHFFYSTRTLFCIKLITVGTRSSLRREAVRLEFLLVSGSHQ